MACYLGFSPVETERGYYFVSYNSDDLQRIQPLVKGLFEAGLPLWYDYALEYGKEWKKQIARKINGSDAVLLFLTRGVVEKESSFVREEYDMATEFFDKKVYVVLLDKIQKNEIPIDSVPWWMEVIKNHVIDLTRVSATEAQVGEICTALGVKPRQAESVGADEPVKKDTPATPSEPSLPPVSTAPVSAGLPKSPTSPLCPPVGDPEPTRSEPYIYVSYAHRNRDMVSPVIRGLKDQGVRVELDTGLEAGSEWYATIRRKPLEKTSI